MPMRPKSKSTAPAAAQCRELAEAQGKVDPLGLLDADFNKLPKPKKPKPAKS